MTLSQNFDYMIFISDQDVLNKFKISIIEL